MAFTIPDKGEGLDDAQSILWQEHIRILQEAIKGDYGVISGLVVTPNNPGVNLNVDISAGVARFAGVDYVVAGITNLNLAGLVHPTNPSFVLFVVDYNAGTPVVAYSADAATTPPKLTTRAANTIILAALYVPPAATSYTAANIVDARAFLASPDKANAFYESNQVVKQDYTVPTGKNAMAAGPIEVATGVTVTVSDGSTLTIV